MTDPDLDPLDIEPLESPSSPPSPYRIDWLDDEIDSLRTFDPESQRSTGTLPEIRVLPRASFP